MSCYMPHDRLKGNALTRHRMRYEGDCDALAHHCLLVHDSQLSRADHRNVDIYRHGVDQGSWSIIDRIHRAAHDQLLSQAAATSGGESASDVTAEPAQAEVAPQAEMASQDASRASTAEASTVVSHDHTGGLRITFLDGVEHFYPFNQMRSGWRYSAHRPMLIIYRQRGRIEIPLLNVRSIEVVITND